MESVLITELRASTYYAELHLRRGEDRTVVSSRPSDAVAVAVRTETPIFVADELMESEGIILALDSDEENDDIPEELVVDLTGLDIGDTVRAVDIALPHGVELAAQLHEATVASIATSSALQSEEAGETEAGEATEGAAEA